MNGKEFVQWETVRRKRASEMTLVWYRRRARGDHCEYTYFIIIIIIMISMELEFERWKYKPTFMLFIDEKCIRAFISIYRRNKCTPIYSRVCGRRVSIASVLQHINANWTPASQNWELKSCTEFQEHWYVKENLEHRDEKKNIVVDIVSRLTSSGTNTYNTFTWTCQAQLKMTASDIWSLF